MSLVGEGEGEGGGVEVQNTSGGVGGILIKDSRNDGVCLRRLEEMIVRVAEDVSIFLRDMRAEWKTVRDTWDVHCSRYI